jgi:uncharacterized membrane protein YkvA (DUF1232 family)
VKVQIKEHVRQHHPWNVFQFIWHLPNFVRLFGRLLGDGRVNPLAKALLVAAAIYAISPLDFIPDFFPIVGQADDLGIFLMACQMFINLAPREVVMEHVKEIDGSGRWIPFGK